MRTRLTVAAALLVASCSSNDGIDHLDPRVTTSAALASFDSCDALTKRLRKDLSNEMKSQLLQYLDPHYGYYYGVPGIANDSAGNADTTAAAPKTPQEGVDYSGTNNQETGVDEGDFVKTDGTHIFVLNGNELVVIAVPEFGQLQQTASVTIEGYPEEMLISGNTVVVFSQVYPQQLDSAHPLYAFAATTNGSFRSTELTKLTFIDVSNQAAPATKRELYVEGYYSTSRKIDTSIRMISYAYMNLWDLQYYPDLPENYWQLPQGSAQQKEILRQAVLNTIAKNNAIIARKPLSDFVPNIYTRVGNIITEQSFGEGECRNFAMADDAVSRGVTSVVSFDVTRDGFDADHIISNASTVYASADTLIIAEPAWNWWWYYGQEGTLDDMTNVHRFDISKPGVTTYTGSGRVDGFLWSQFNLSERDGVVRLATTSNMWSRWWVENPPQVSSNIFTMKGDSGLTVVGSLTGISEGERLYAARFVDDNAYLVTARVIDPLWTVDLSDPANPNIVSSLDVPGVSTYVQPLDGGRLLSIGYAGNETEISWGTTQLSLYDVSTATAPQLDATLQLAPPNNGWSYSEAQYEHKAFQYWAPKALLAIPIVGYGSSGNGYSYYSTLQLVSVGADSLGTSGSIDHSQYFNNQASGYWANPSIRRSIFMGDYVVAISDRAVTATHLGDFTQSAFVQLPGNYAPIWFE